MPPSEVKWPPPGSWPGEGPTEPSADVREAARQTMEIYAAFLNVGFSEEQAFAMVMALMTKQDR